MRPAVRTLIALWAVALAACGGDSSGPGRPDTPDPVITGLGTPVGPLVTVTVGAAGGVVQSSDNRWRMTIPAGALSSDTPIGIQQISNESPGSVGTYRFTPDGLTFAAPVTVRVYYDTTMVEGTRPDLLTVATHLADGTWGLLDESEVTLQIVDAAVEFRTTHFSDYTMLQGLQIRPPEGEIDPGQSIDLEVRDCTNYEERSGSDYSGYVINCDDADPDLPALPRYRIEVASWAANGVRGGNAAVGFVAGSGRNAQYVAPQNPPAGNPVAVSVKVRDASGQEVSTLVANIKVRNTCENPTTVRGVMRRLDCGVPPELTGFSNTTVSDITPVYTLGANITWVYDTALSLPGQTAWYSAEGVASFAALDPCISITPGMYNWGLGDATAGGTLEVNLQDSTWTATGVALWTASYLDTCDENAEPGEAGAGGTWLNATGTLNEDWSFIGTVSNSGQTFSFNWGPPAPPTLRAARKR